MARAISIIFVACALGIVAWKLCVMSPAPSENVVLGDGSAAPQSFGSLDPLSFTPDLPARMYTASELVISDAPTSMGDIVYDGSSALSVNTPPRVNCLYWEGNLVVFVVLVNGRRVRVPCER